MLLEKVWKSRQARFVAFSLKLMAQEPALYKETGFADSLGRFKNLQDHERLHLVEYPPFMIWLKQSLRALASQSDLKKQLADFNRVIAAFEARGEKTTTISSHGRKIEAIRFDVDSLILQAAAPEYIFPDVRRQREFEETAVYPLSFFVEMLSQALVRMERTWPEAHRDFFKFVRMVVDMIDSEFTSYSACDHTGAIFVSTDNSPLIALEEYLIHEFGHQILYSVMELEPLVKDGLMGTYKLPWSGNERDFYGYFHAFYIYILMAHYYRRMEGRSRREERRKVSRIRDIVKGLTYAIPELEGANGFTPRGQQLFENLKAEVQGLVAVQDPACQKSEKTSDEDERTLRSSQTQVGLILENESSSAPV
jgi:hypothetical protein